MRTLTVVAITSLIALALASGASAAPTVSLVWTASTGSGTTGGSSIDAVAGDTLTLDIIINAGACDADCTTFEGLSLDVSAAGAVDTYYRAGLDSINDGTGASVYPSAAASYSSGALAFVSAVTCPGPPALGNLAPGFCGNAFHGALGSASDLGSGIIGSFAAAGITGITAPFTLGQVVFDVVPEPATGGLLALGLGVLAFIGRRRA